MDKAEKFLKEHRAAYKHEMSEDCISILDARIYAKMQLKEHFDVEVISLMAVDIIDKLDELPKTKDDFPHGDLWDEYRMRKIRPIIKDYIYLKK